MDLALLTFFNQTLAHPLLDLLMVGLTFGGLALLPSLGLVWLVGKRRRVGLAILAALTASLVLTFIFQYLALRLRPEGVRLLFPTPNFPSYPSGHAATAFAAALVLALTYRRWRWFLWPQVGVVAVITHMAYLDILPLGLLAWPMADKILHFILFGLVVFWLSLWLEGRIGQWRQWFIPPALLGPLLVASLEEMAQYWSPLRTASLADWLSDLAGMIFFWWLSRQVLKLKSPKQAI